MTRADRFICKTDGCKIVLTVCNGSIFVVHLLIVTVRFRNSSKDS